MNTARAFHHAACALAAAATFGLHGPGTAKVLTDARGAWVEGPEDAAAPKARHTKDRFGETAVLTRDERPTNLRKSGTFVAIMGASALR